MSYSQDPDYWTEDDPRTKSTAAGKANLPMVQPAQRNAVRRITADESAALQGMTQTALQPSTQQMIQLQEWEGTHTGHVRHVEDPVTNASASLIYSAAYIIVVAIAVAALLILTDLADGDFIVFIGLELLGTTVASFFVLAWNREQGLHHSATGIGHSELKTREKMYSRLAQVEEYRIDANKEIELERLRGQRELAAQYLRYLEGPDK
jgi:hypothetical protein